MKKYRIGVVVLTMIVVSACKKAPISCFVMSSESVSVGSPVVCDGSCSKNTKKFVWLSEGIRIPGNSEESIDTIIFHRPGTYSIRLQVLNGNKEDISSKTVTVH